MMTEAEEHFRYLARRRRNSRLLALAVLLGAGGILFEVSRESRAAWLQNATIVELRRAAAANPRDDELAYTLSFRDLMRTGDTAEGYRLMRGVVRRNPRSWRYWYGFARIAAADAHPTEAAGAYQKALEVNPSFVMARWDLAQLYAEAGLTTDALKEYDAAVKLDPNPANQRGDVWAKCLMAHGRLNEAYDYLARSLLDNPGVNEPYDILTDLGIRLRSYDKAAAVLQRRIEMGSAPHYSVGQFQNCMVRLLLAKSHDMATLRIAEQFASDAVTDMYAKAPYFAGLGRVRLLRGNLAGARQALENGLNHEGDKAECLSLLADVYARSGEAGKAANMRKRVAALPREDPRIAAARKAADAAPKDARARLTLAQALRAAGRPGEAAEECYEILKESPADQAAASLRDACRTEALQRLAAQPKDPSRGA